MTASYSRAATSPTWFVVAGAALGSTSSLVGLLASWWALAGETPAFVFARFETMRAWRSGEVYGGLPFEFWTLLWFSAVGAVALHRCAHLSRPEQLVLLVSGVGLTGLAAGRAWDAQLTIWPLNIMTTASVGLLFGSSMTFERRAATPQRPPSRSRRLLTFALIGTICIVGHLMRLHLTSVPARLAAERNFHRWFEATRSQVRPRSSSEVIIEVFNDYHCPFCAVAVPRMKALVEQYRLQASRPVTLSLRDFPLDSSCNPGLSLGPHPGACETAVFVRFCRAYLSAEASDQAVSWVYAQGSDLSHARLRDYLEVRGLADEFDSARSALQASVAADVTAALERGVRATPTVFVAGVQLPNHVYLDSAVRFLLEAVGPQ